MDFALSELKATMVDVNEENLNAVQFYKKFGFQVYDKIEEDPEGKDYPILKMKLQDANKLPG
jgi:putative acetyltransferase